MPAALTAAQFLYHELPPDDCAGFFAGVCVFAATFGATLLFRVFCAPLDDEPPLCCQDVVLLI